MTLSHFLEPCDPHYSSGFAELVDVCGVIDGIHGVGPNSRPLCYSSAYYAEPNQSDINSLGCFYLEDGPADRAVIALRPSAPEKRVVACHELGHYVADCLFRSSSPASFRARMSHVMGRIATSDAVRHLETLAAGSVALTLYERREVVVMSSQEVREQARYMLRPEERFARAYVQFIARYLRERKENGYRSESGDRFLDEFESFSLRPGVVYFKELWTQEDFEPIFGEFIRLLSTSD